MDSNTMWTMVMALLPGILVAVIAYGLIDKFLKSETIRREIEVRKINTSQIIPQRLAAYERMALFLERIKPTGLTRRISPQSTAKNYEAILIQTIQGEWEHNLSQQIYVNPDSWKLIYSAKNATQNFIRQCAADLGEDASAADLQEYIIKRSISENAPSNDALLKIQVDIQGNL
ncbi:DUF7935 family protein [Moheibacter lacus]|uniref:Uncharacterized protein n=1 Tax=Moheibacter lacus TaxID=2745851 RepID=A0A838ZT53_9FLAO|nr:hypothetical protein [Moheibacter lacus]MBA5630160.1 hypothetical protein [Moheibacter lacus]